MSQRSLHPAQVTSVLATLDDGGAPRAEVVPSEVSFRLPVHRGFVRTVGSVVEATVALVDRDVAAGIHLEAAVLTLADAMILQACPWAPLDVSIAIDDTDVYVRLTTDLGEECGPPLLSEHRRATLRRSVESFELVADGGALSGVLQVPLEPASST